MDGFITRQEGKQGIMVQFYPTSAVDRLQILYPQDPSKDITILLTSNHQNGQYQEQLRVGQITWMGDISMDTLWGSMVELPAFPYGQETCSICQHLITIQEPWYYRQEQGAVHVRCVISESSDEEQAT